MKKMDDDLDEVATRTRFVLSPRRGCGLLRFEQRREGLTVLPDDGKAFGAITVDLSSASILRRVQQGLHAQRYAPEFSPLMCGRICQHLPIEGTAQHPS
jgi:hypothetical protein